MILYKMDTIRSSYKNKDIDYGKLIETVTYSINPKNILEIGILDGYSLESFQKGSSKNTVIKAFDIFDDFNGNHSNEREIKELFKQHKNVEIGYGDFFKLHEDNTTKLLDNSIDIIHIDIANNGDTYDYAIKHYMPKLSPDGIMILEGGSEERDEVSWMVKYNKPKIQPILQKYNELYNIKIIGTLPSITLIKKIINIFY